MLSRRFGVGALALAVLAGSVILDNPEDAKAKLNSAGEIVDGVAGEVTDVVGNQRDRMSGRTPDTVPPADRPAGSS